MIVKDKPVLYLMIGPSGGGKSTIAKKVFNDHEIVSYDDIREKFFGSMFVQDHGDIVSKIAHDLVDKKLSIRQRVVVDATNLKMKYRKVYHDLAREHGVEIVYVIVDRPLEEKIRDGGWRNDVIISGKSLVEIHHERAISAIHEARKFAVSAGIKVIEGHELVGGKPAIWDSIVNDKFDELVGGRDVQVISDVHGQLEMLKGVLEEDMFTIFLGDLVDRGPDSWGVVELVHERVSRGDAISVLGNHDHKLARWIKQWVAGKAEESKIKFTGGLDMTIEQFHSFNNAKRRKLAYKLLDLHARMPLWINWGKYHFAHAGFSKNMLTERRTHFNSHVSGPVEHRAIYERDWNLSLNDLPAGHVLFVGHQPQDEIVVHESENGAKMIMLDLGAGHDNNIGEAKIIKGEIHALL